VSRAFQPVAIVMAVLFLISAVLQYNDPDPIQWGAIYLAAALLSGWAAFRAQTLRWQPPALVGIVAVVWAIAIATHMHGTPAFADLFKTMKAETPPIEESREPLGLLIVALWMAILAFRHRGHGPHQR